MKYKLNLQQFAEDGMVAAGPETAGAETAAAVETAEPVTISAGDTLKDGTQVSSQVAAAMNRQMERHPELKKVYGQGLNRSRKGQPQAAPTPGATETEKSIEERWDELRKGEFAELYGRDVQAAVQDRFKNQADNQAAMKTLEPMLDVLRQRAGVQTNEELVKYIMDDDSLYEEAASAAGMTIPAYREFMQIKQERDEAQAREQESIPQQMLYDHYQKLSQQAEEFRNQLPGFDLDKELKENPDFLRLTSPEVGLDVQTAFFALHKDEMMPQAMMAGMERAKQQMGQTIQAQHKRPAEGAMKSRGAAASDFNFDPRSMTRPERNRLYELIHKRQVTVG